MNFLLISHELKKLGITNYTIRKDNSVDVHTTVDISVKNLSCIPVKFHHIQGDFDCSDNVLVSLTNSPEHVDGFFNCSFNCLESLQYSPKTVRDFDCSNNQLRCLKGVTKDIPVNFTCSSNSLLNFQDGPEHVENNYTVEYAPVCFDGFNTVVDGYFRHVLRKETPYWQHPLFTYHKSIWNKSHFLLDVTMEEIRSTLLQNKLTQELYSHVSLKRKNKI